MKGIITFLITWIVAYVAGVAGVGFFAGIVYFAFTFFHDNEVLLVFIMTAGFIVTMYIWLRLVFGLLNRWLERW